MKELLTRGYVAVRKCVKHQYPVMLSATDETVFSSQKLCTYVNIYEDKDVMIIGDGSWIFCYYSYSIALYLFRIILYRYYYHLLDY